MSADGGRAARCNDRGFRHVCRRDIMCGGHAFKAGAPEPMEIRRIRADEGLRLRALQLHALGDSPTAYGSTLATEELYPESIWHEKAVSGAAGDKVVTIVAEHDNRLLGMATELAIWDPPAHDELNPTMVAVFVDDTVHVGRLGCLCGSRPAMNLPLRFTVAADFELPVQPDRTRTRLLLSNARCCWTFDARHHPLSCNGPSKESDHGTRRAPKQALCLTCIA